VAYKEEFIDQEPICL